MMHSYAAANLQSFAFASLINWTDFAVEIVECAIYLQYILVKINFSQFVLSN
jgi:hypothetical protein